MKWSLVHIILGILIIILIACGEVRYLRNFTEELTNELESVEISIESNDENGIKVCMDNVMNLWEKHEKILLMLIDYQDIHKIEALLVKTDKIIKNNLYDKHVSTNFALLKLYIENISEGSKFTLENLL